MVHLYLMAGEASGDNLGAGLMDAVGEAAGEPCHYSGVGGEQMRARGLDSLFPMQELSLLGFMEILPHIPRLLARIRMTAEDILAKKPDVVVTIDAPAFTRRVIQKLRALPGGKEIPCVHYVAPSVWAYKPSRAKKMAALYDHMLALLPFEPPYFEQEGLPCTYVGHPALAQKLTGGDGARFRAAHAVPPEAPVLCLTPGSRSSELRRLLPIYRETLAQLHANIPNLHALIMATPRFEARLQEETHDWPNVHVACPSTEQEKADLLAACDAALVKSGTGSFDFALAGVPMVIAYRVHPFSAWWLRRLIRIRYACLLNLVLDEEVVPEYLQERCMPDLLASALAGVLEDQENVAFQHEGVLRALAAFGQGDEAGASPSARAAEVVLRIGKPG